jgi:hypothetical protein
MSEGRPTAECAGCGYEFQAIEPHVACPNCCAEQRKIMVSVGGVVGIRGALKWRQRRHHATSPKGKTVLQGEDGWGVGGDGRPRKKLRIIDRLLHRYRERVELDDGTVVRDVDEDLREHVSETENKCQS